MKKIEYKKAGIEQLRDLDKKSREMQQAQVPAVQSKFQKLYKQFRTLITGLLFAGIMW